MYRSRSHRMAEHQPPAREGVNPGNPEPTPDRVRPEDVVSTDTLDFLVEGVRVRFVPLTPAAIAQADREGRSGWYTTAVNDPKVPVKEIHYNPTSLGRSPEAVRATALHEALHHARPVAALDHEIEGIAARAVIPDRFASTPRLRALFPLVIRAYLGSGATDRFLESYALRGAYRTRFLPDYQAKTAPGKDGRDLRTFPLPQQFVQALLGAERFYGGPRRDTVDDRVAAEIAACAHAFDAMSDVTTYENPLRTDRDERRDVTAKAFAFASFLLPAFVRLLNAETEPPEPPQTGTPEPGTAGTPESPSGAQQLTPEQREAIAKLLEQLIAEGMVHFAPPSEGDPLTELLRAASTQPNTPDATPAPRPGDAAPEAPTGEEGGEEGELAALREGAMGAAERLAGARTRGLAERHGVPVEAVRAYEQYTSEYREVIAALRDRIAEAMREERRARLGLTERTGEVTPGLEAEALSAAYAGEPDERVHMRMEESTRCTRVRLLFVVDVSGSMGGAPMDASRAAFVIINEAFAETHALLNAEALMEEDEEPIEVGLLAFASGTAVVHPLGAPLDERAKFRMLHALQAGGGTNDYDALERAVAEVEARALVSPEEFVDLVLVFTDAEGDEAQVRAFCDRIRATGKVSLGAFGFGSAKVRAVYGGRPGGVDAVYGDDVPRPQDAIPRAGEFIAGRIERAIEARGGGAG